MKRLKDVLEHVLKDLRERRDARERQEKTEREKAAGRDRAKRERAKLLKTLDAELDKDEPDKERVHALKREIGRLHRKAQRRDHEHDHAVERLRELASKIRWGVKRRTVLRKKIREAKAERSPTPAAWQANGHEWHNLTDRAKKLLAIAVVTYDNVCTSITRDWGTGSHHEDVPTRGFDCAGARMEQFQKDLRFGRIEGFDLPDLLELFGPDNAACANDSKPYFMSEGSGIEQLHDNHTHAFVYGS